jgi:hypothetical protein
MVTVESPVRPYVGVPEAYYSRYWLTRVVFLRALAAIQCVAFAIAWAQNEYLLGDVGLTPAVIHVQHLKGSLLRGHSIPTEESSYDSWGHIVKLVLMHPTIYWMVPPTSANLNTVAIVGLLLAAFVLFAGRSNMLIQFTIWALYMSIVNVGQTWYGFGWETQLLETTFLSIFMVPTISLQKYPAHTPTSITSLLGYRWLLFRIMVGAGMIKLRGDSCWLDLTCMNYHYQTQPVPNPFSPYFHATPQVFHKVETLGNHLVEVVLPWMLLMPRSFRIWGGVIQILFQVAYIRKPISY